MPPGVETLEAGIAALKKEAADFAFEVVPLTSFSRNIVEHLLRGTTVSSHAHMFDSHRCSICYHAAVIVNL